MNGQELYSEFTLPAISFFTLDTCAALNLMYFHPSLNIFKAYQTTKTIVNYFPCSYHDSNVVSIVVWKRSIAPHEEVLRPQKDLEVVGVVRHKLDTVIHPSTA